jgi:hypothetical protein
VIEVLRAADIGSTFNGGHVEEEKVTGAGLVELVN